MSDTQSTHHGPRSGSPAGATPSGESAALDIARRAAAQAATLQRLTAALSGALREEEVGEIVLRQALPAFGAAAGDVVLLTDDASGFRALCWVGYPEELIRSWMRYPLESGTPAAEIVRTGAPVFLSDLAAWRERFPRNAPIIEAAGLAGYAGLPLVFEGRVRGALSCNFAEPRHFPPEERAMLLAFAGQCAQALDRAHLFAAEQRARAEAETANRAKSDFLAVMSHELRTPLTSILGYEELLADGVSGPVTDTQRQQLDRIKESALHLLQLIDELLTYARIEAQREVVAAERVDVGGMLVEAAALVQPLAGAKQLALRVDPPTAPLVMVTDARKLRQVLVNLLSNAVKFTEQGEVVVAARADGDEVELVVHDTGIGIAAGDLERIFEPFRQLEPQCTRRAGGTGLGLSVSQRLVRLLGGSVHVASEPGQGSRFTVRLPRVPDPAAAPAR